MRPYTLAEARFVMTHVFCVSCLPEGGMTYDYSRMWGEARCVRCPCRLPADLRLWVPTDAQAKAWLEKENAAIAAA